jgi:hypothetical protein
VNLGSALFGLGVLALTGFVFYLTSSWNALWILLLLLFVL